MANEARENALLQRPESERSGRADSSVPTLGSVEAALRGITAVLEVVRERGEQRHAATERIAAQVQQIEAELQALHKAIGNLSQRVRDQTVTLIRSSIPPSPPKSVTWRRRVVLALFCTGRAGGGLDGRHPHDRDRRAGELVGRKSHRGRSRQPA